MGIYDREYYRREGPSFLGSLVERGKVCTWLLAINIVCFLLQKLTAAGPHQPFTKALWLDPALVLQGQVWRLLTCAFLHDTANIWHIVFNMLFLWMFGRQMEDDYGPREFLGFYLVSAVVSSLAFLAATLVGLHSSGPALGASGAVTAATILYALHYPRRIILLFFFLPVPIWAFAVFLVIQNAFGLLGRSQNGIGTSAHLGGAAFALAYHQFHLRLTGWIKPWRSWEGWQRRRRPAPSLRIYREEEPPTPVSVAAPMAATELEALREEMDAILEKISLVGKDNLTENERQVLLRASEVFKRRRG